MSKPSRSYLKPAVVRHAAGNNEPSSETLIGPLGRRQFFGVGGKVVAFLAAYQAVRPLDSALAQLGFDPFTYGVAAGDPLPDRVIIWTRVNPSAAATPGSGLGGAVRGVWEVARDAAFTQRVTTGRFTATAATDHTVKVDVSGLLPYTLYYYRFNAFGVFSPVGRMLTAPAAGSSPGSVRFGMVSCSNFEAGYFTAYRHLALRDDLDFVLHLGDYIYEYANGQYGPAGFAGVVRVHDPATEMISLSDYRRRHATYKADPDLRSLHARYAFITTWDDHEVTNDAWRDGAQNHTEGAEGAWALRKAAGYQAYFEWMPVRPPQASGSVGEVRRIYRKFSFGDLADLFMLDLRQYRDQQPASQTDSAAINNPARTLLGDPQMLWLQGELTTTPRRWKLMGNSVMIAPVILVPSLVPAQLQGLLAILGLSPTINTATPINVDSWDGYQADRGELLAVVAGALGAPVGNAVFLTGDIHSSWACDIPANPATYHRTLNNNSLATEFVCTSVSSDNINESTGLPERIEGPPGVYTRNPATPGVEQTLRAFNAWVQELEFDAHGYCVAEVTASRMQVDYWFIRSAANPADPRVDINATTEHFASYQTVDGSKKITTAAGQLGPRI